MTAFCPECKETKLDTINHTIIDTVLQTLGIHHYRCTFCHRETYSSASLLVSPQKNRIESSHQRAA